MDSRRPCITVDAVVIQNDEVLLIKRNNPPFKGMWALPGGFVEYGETCEEAVDRELHEETGIHMIIDDLIGVYSDPKRDPRGHTISVVFDGAVKSGVVKAGDDAGEAKFFKLNMLPVLAFDHKKILNDAMERKR